MGGTVCWRILVIPALMKTTQSKRYVRGLELITAVTAIKWRASLQTRVGIATGASRCR